jgi:DNA-binding transcriptional ArsR family regulator
MNGGFLVGQSIMLELSFGICTELYELPPYQKEAYEKWSNYLKVMLPDIPNEFIKKWQDLWSEDFKPQVIITHLADIADAIFETDYEIAKKKMQSINFASAYKRILEHANDYDLLSDNFLSEHENFAKLATKIRQFDHKEVGFALDDNSTFVKNNYLQYLNLILVLKDEPLHEKFWELIDEFYYSILKPWRADRQSAIKAYYQKAIKDLGGEKSERPPDLNNLPFTLSREIAEQVSRQNKGIFYWVDPFNYHGVTSLRHNYLMVGCNNHFFYFHEVDQGVIELTNGLKALSDPTRIKILRLIRHFSMDNTQMADFLNITRPTVSNHTKILREANLIESKLEGRSTRHYINVENINKLVANLSVFLDIL